MSLIDFNKNNYEARRVLLNNILLENKDNIVLETYNSSYIQSNATKYKFTLKIDRYRIVGLIDYKDDKVQYLSVNIYYTSWLGLLSDFLGYCIFSWEYPSKELPEDIKQSKAYLHCVLKNKVSNKIHEEKRKAEKVQKKELEEGHKLTKAFVNYFKRSCSTSD